MALSLNKIKQIRSFGLKKFRNESGLFVVEGEKLVDEVINSDFEVVEIYRREEIGESDMKRISQLSSPSPVLAVVKQKDLANFNISDLEIASQICYLILDGVKDPGNLGSIIRTAEWFGFNGIIASSDSVELYNPKTIHATMGAIFRMKVFYSPLHSVILQLKEMGVEIFATLLNGNVATNLSEHVRQNCCAFVFGNESHGISEEVEHLIEPSHRILLPQFDKYGNISRGKMYSGSESLNVAASVAALSALIREH